MKLLKAFVFFFFAGFMAGNTQSVVNSTLYELNPLFVNPAKSGDFLGTLRVGGLYREQWGFSQVTTPFAYFDSPILNGFRKKKDDWVGIGAIFYKDVAGIGNLPTIGYYLSAAYHFDIGDKKTRRVFTVGLQWGQETFGDFNLSGYSIADTYDASSNSFGSIDASSDPYKNISLGGIGGQGQGQGQSTPGGKNTINAGLVFKTNKNNSKESFEAGFSMSNINSLTSRAVIRSIGNPPVDTTGGNQPVNPGVASATVPTFFSGHIMLRRELRKDELYLEPTAFVKLSNVWHQYNVHAWLAMNLKDKETETIKDQVLKIGAGYRFTNLNGIPTPQLLLGYEKDALRVAFAYDIYLGKTLDQKYAFELAANYIISSQPKIELPSKIFCPRL